MEVQRKLKKLPLHSLPHRKPWLLNRNLKGDLILVPQDFCLEWVGGGGGGGGGVGREAYLRESFTLILV